MKARSRLLVLLCCWFLIAVFVTAFFKSRAIATTDYARQTGQLGIHFVDTNVTSI